MIQLLLFAGLPLVCAALTWIVGVRWASGILVAVSALVLAFALAESGGSGFAVLALAPFLALGAAFGVAAGALLRSRNYGWGAAALLLPLALLLPDRFHGWRSANLEARAMDFVLAEPQVLALSGGHPQAYTLRASHRGASARFAFSLGALRKVAIVDITTAPDSARLLCLKDLGGPMSLDCKDSLPPLP